MKKKTSKKEELGKLIAGAVMGMMTGEGKWGKLKKPGARDILPARPVEKD